MSRYRAKNLPPMSDVFRARLFDRMFSSIKRVVSTGWLTPCWEWGKYVDIKGYGKTTVKDASFLAHRVMHELLIGPIPVGLVPDHLCRFRACINPYHVELVSNVENIHRGSQRQATHCKRGHAFDDLNTAWIVRPDGTQYRNCKACLDLGYQRRYYGDHEASKQKNREAYRQKMERTS